MITILVCGGRGFGNWKEVPLLEVNGPMNKKSPEFLAKSKEYEYIMIKLTNFCYKKNLVDDTQRIFDLRVVTGGATGADSVAIDFAMQAGPNVELKVYKADWEKHGVAAGPIRNAEMLEKENIDVVIAFPGGKGTADMIKKAQKAGVPVLDYREDYYDNDNII